MKESRRSKRKNMTGDVKTSNNGGTYVGGLRDISEGGISVETSTPYEVGYEMYVTIELPEALESVTALAEVVWVHPLEATFHPTGMGLKFLALKDEDYYKLEKILELG
ncbi:MAG: PilZ domain-containing protein [Syntrophobacterales bacterium]|jgi:Tfp pilus assembly protein PilZ